VEWDLFAENISGATRHMTDRSDAARKAWATRRKRIAVGFYKDKKDKTRPITKPVAELKRKKVIQKPKRFKGVSPGRGKVEKIAEGEMRILGKWASNIALAGSLRRKQPNPKDVDIVVVPKNAAAKQRILEYAMKQKRGNIGRGEKLVAYRKGGVEVDVYFAEPKYYGAMLMFLTGPNRYNIALRRIAKTMGLKLNQYGVWRGEKCLASKTEKDIYRKLGKTFKSPELRGLSETEAKKRFGVTPGTRIL